METENETFVVMPDPAKLCRLCANTHDQLIPIFKEGIDLNISNISNKIEKHLPIVKISEEDKLPLQICYQCASTLIAWHNFYEGCGIADTRLRKILCVDEKISQDDSFDDCLDELQVDYDDEESQNNLIENVRLTSASSSSQADDVRHVDNTAVNELSETKIYEETENDNHSDERCIARAGRKRGPLTTKIRMMSSIKEERAKIVKSKKINLLALSAAKKLTKHHCKYCNTAFLDVNIRNYHQETAHPEVKFGGQQRNGNTLVKRKVARTNTRLSLRLQEKLTLLKMKLNMDPQVNIVNDQPAKGSDKRSKVVIKVNQPTKESDKKRKNIVVKDTEEKANSQELKVTNGSKDKKSNVVYHSCGHCDYKCKRKYDIKRHISKLHPLVEIVCEDLLFCALCDQVFKTKKAIREHMIELHLEEHRHKFIKGFCCDRCGIGFRTLHEMLSHRYLHHVDTASMKWSSFRSSWGKVKLCRNCNQSYREGRFFEEHTCLRTEDKNIMNKIVEMQDMKPTFKCDLCSMCFLWKWIYRQHREITHLEAEIKNWDLVEEEEITNYCASCFLSFPNEDAIKDHKCMNFDLEPQLKLYECDTCGSRYQRRSDFQRHLRNKHFSPDSAEYALNVYKRKSKIKCPYCEMSTVTRNGILAHIKEAHNIEMDTPFVCAACNKVFKRKATMDTHNQVYHPKEENVEETNKILKEAEILLNGEVAYHCDMCNRNMFNKMRFVAHYRLHRVERRFTCDLCGKQTRTQHQLNSHIKIIHLDIRNYKCDVCGKTFHAKQSCEEHRRIHTGERPYSCEICGKTFIAMNALFTHKKFHNDFFAHPCTMCPKKFKVRRSLINHIRTHTGERPFKCELCPKTFNNSSRFSYHKKVTHSDARPFSCSLCGSCFKANKFLMRHMKLHNIRTHIQFRRRNNPEYFGIYDSNSKVNSGSQNKIKKNEVSIEEKSYSNEMFEETISNLNETYDDSAELQLNHNIENANDRKNHFLCVEFNETGVHEESSSSSTVGSNVIKMETT